MIPMQDVAAIVVMMGLFLLAITGILAAVVASTIHIMLSCEDSVSSKCENFTEWHQQKYSYRTQWQRFLDMWSWQ